MQQSLLLISTSQEGTKGGRKCDLKRVELGNEAPMLSTHQVRKCSLTRAPGQQGLPGRALGQTGRHWDLNASLCGSQFGLIVHRLSEGLRRLLFLYLFLIFQFTFPLECNCFTMLC